MTHKKSCFSRKNRKHGLIKNFADLCGKGVIRLKEQENEKNKKKITENIYILSRLTQ
jgi:hypothetical protein